MSQSRILLPQSPLSWCWLALALVLPLGHPAPVAADEAVWRYTVRPGDNIWDLSRRYLADWRNWPQIQAINRIDEPRRIPPGSRLDIPLRLLRLENVPATLARAYGDVQVRRADAPLEVAAGATLEIGDRVITGAGGGAVIRFADGSEVHLAGSSELHLDSLRRYRGTTMVDTRLRLERGRLETIVQPAAGDGSRFEVWTPPATTSVRGTDLRVGLDAAIERSATEVLDGRVTVEARATPRDVTAGFGTVTREGEPPAPPRPLLPAPAAADVPVRLERLPLRLPMPALPGAERFRLTLASADGLPPRLADQLIPAAGAARLELPDGSYAARLRGIAADGLEGEDLAWRLEVDARPEPPTPLRPQRDGRLRDPLPQFAWSEPLGARAYRLALAAEPDFGGPLVMLDRLTAPTFTPAAPLPLGTYYWRLATIDSDDQIGPWSDVARFEIVAPPADPTIDEVASDRGRLTIRLAGLEPGQEVRFQLARDAAFAEPVADRTVAEPELVVPGLLPGDYWFQAQIIEADGYVAPFGTPQRITVEPARWWPALLIPFALMLLLL